MTTTTYTQGQELWAWASSDDPEGMHYLATSRDAAIVDAARTLDTREGIVVYPATAPRYPFDGDDALSFFLEQGEDAACDVLRGEEDGDVWHALPGAAEALEAALTAWGDKYLRVTSASIDTGRKEIIRASTWHEAEKP